MIARVLSAALLWLALSGAALADRAEQMARLVEVLRIADTVGIMREEGLIYGADLSESFLGETAGAAWMARVESIYAPGRMQELVAGRLETALADADLAPIIAYFASEEGQHILQLELSARRAFMDAETEEAAMIRYEEAVEADARIVVQIETLIADSDLLERNVAGGLNANLMFYRGMADAGGYDGSDEDMLRDVWAQEEDMRVETSRWLESYLMMAYHPLDPEVLDGYAEFFRTGEGRALNRALFEAFNAMYDQLSYLMGSAVAERRLSERL